MNDLINLGNLTKPADTLVKKISNAVGVLFEPRQIIRIAEARRKANMESITAKALPAAKISSKNPGSCPQSEWSRVLAGEANDPDSKRTVNFLSERSLGDGKSCAVGVRRRSAGLVKFENLSGFIRQDVPEIYRELLRQSCALGDCLAGGKAAQREDLSPCRGTGERRRGPRTGSNSGRRPGR